MSKITKAVGRLFGVPKAPKVQTVLDAPAEENTPAPLPVEDDQNIRAAVLEREKRLRANKGRKYTQDPGRSLGGAGTTLG